MMNGTGKVGQLILRRWSKIRNALKPFIDRATNRQLWRSEQCAKAEPISVYL